MLRKALSKITNLLSILLLMMGAVINAQVEWATITAENATNLVPVATFDFSSDTVFDIVFTPDSTALAVATGGDLRLINVRESTEPRIVYDSTAFTVALSPDGNTAAIATFQGGAYGIAFVNLANDEIEQFLPIEVDDAGPRVITSIAFNPDGSQLAYADNLVVTNDHFANLSEPVSGIVHVVSLDTNTEEFSREHENPIAGRLFFSTDGKTLIYNTIVVDVFEQEKHADVHFVDTTTHEAVNRLDTNNIIVEAISADGSQVALSGRYMVNLMLSISTGLGNNNLSMFTSETNEVQPLTMDSEFEGALGGFAFSPDGTLLTTVPIGPLQMGTTSRAYLNLWAIETGEQLASYELGASSWATSTFSPDGTHIAVLISHDTQDYEVQLWAALPEGICSVTARSNANLRGGPGTNFEVAGSIASGETAYVSGQATDASGFVWWQLMSNAWVRSDLVDTTGNCDTVPEVDNEN